MIWLENINCNFLIYLLTYFQWSSYRHVTRLYLIQHLLKDFEYMSWLSELSGLDPFQNSFHFLYNISGKDFRPE